MSDNANPADSLHDELMEGSVQGTTSQRPVELRMEDGTWEPGTLKTLSCEGARALIEWQGITAWFWRWQGSGHVDEWRFSDV